MVNSEWARARAIVHEFHELTRIFQSGLCHLVFIKTALRS